MQIKKNHFQIKDNIFLINDSMFPLYLILGEKNVLIDCSILGKIKKIEENISILLENRQLNHVFLTHSHYDHTGACSVLQKKHDFSVFCSQRTKEILENRNAINFIDDLNQKFNKLIGFYDEIHFSQIEKLIPVHEEDKIEIGNCQYFQVLETPGHTKCSISFFLYPQRILFCGDAAGVKEKNGVIKPLFLSSYAQYESSIAKLKNLDVEILALPHNCYIKGNKKVQKFLQESTNETQRIKEVIINHLKAQESIETIADKILGVEFPQATVMGPIEAIKINIHAMISAIKKEFLV